MSPGELYQQRYPRKLLTPGWLYALWFWNSQIPTHPLPGAGAREPTWDCWPSLNREPPSYQPFAGSSPCPSAKAVFLSFMCVFSVLGLHHLSSCHFCGLGPGLNYSQKMILCTVAHLDRSLIFTVVKVIRFRIKWFYITTSCGLLDCVMGQGWVGSRHTGLASGKRLYVLGNVKMRMKVFK